MKNRHGFTLLEIAMMVVIISLIAGAIVAGSNLIRSAQIRSAIDEAQRYTQAIHNFQDKYKSLPGDFYNATNVFGAGAAIGNGDGVISPRLTSNEQFLAWQHLALAGMIEGQFPFTNITTSRVPGVDIPRSRVDGGGWGLITLTSAEVNNATPGYDFTASDYTHNEVVMFLGANSNTAVNYFYQDPVLIPQEANSIDSKVDDGLPASGKVIGSLSSCFIVHTNVDATTVHWYNTAYSLNTPVCSLMFRTGF